MFMSQIISTSCLTRGSSLLSGTCEQAHSMHIHKRRQSHRDNRAQARNVRLATHRQRLGRAAGTCAGASASASASAASLVLVVVRHLQIVVLSTAPQFSSTRVRQKSGSRHTQQARRSRTCA
jgi:hypothetical protein